MQKLEDPSRLGNPTIPERVQRHPCKCQNPWSCLDIPAIGVDAMSPPKKLALSSIDGCGSLHEVRLFGSTHRGSRGKKEVKGDKVSMTE